MPVRGPDEELDFLRRQVFTTRNIRGSRLLDVAMGGLNYQIEHHLFPSMPGPTLRRAQPLVQAFCAAGGLPYRESSLSSSCAQVLRHLDRVGATVRSAAPTEQEKS
jgi:fatty acid desaturase